MLGLAETFVQDRPRMSSGDHQFDRMIEAVALRRDREAFAQLFQHFAPRLKTYLMKAGAPASSAEDFAQEAMLTVWRKADLFDARRANAATWIFTIARNRRLDALRRDVRRLAAPEVVLDGPEPERPDEAFDQVEEAARLEDALTRLTPDQIEVVRMAFFQDQSHSQVADVLALPLGTVKSRLRKAMIVLRTLLEPTRGGIR